MLTPITALILGIVEGISEYLPISSTGHLIIASTILGIGQNEFQKSFEIIIQSGAILAVIALYLKTVLTNRALWGRIAAAFVPTAIVGLVLYKFIKGFLLSSPAIPVVTLFIGGIFLIMFEKISSWVNGKRSVSELPLQQAAAIGIAQSVSVIPGVSRSAASIVGGMMVGLDRTQAVEFSFLLAVPTLLAATGLDLVKSRFAFTAQEYMLLGIGFAASFVTAWLTVKFFLSYVKSHTFVAFGVYRIIAAIVFWLLIIRK